MLKSQLIAAGLELAKRRRNAVERALADMQMFLRETNVEGDFRGNGYQQRTARWAWKFHKLAW